MICWINLIFLLWKYADVREPNNLIQNHQQFFFLIIYLSTCPHLSTIAYITLHFLLLLLEQIILPTCMYLILSPYGIIQTMQLSMLLLSSHLTLPAGNNFGWIRPQCGIIESRVTVCRVFNSRLLYVVRACNLLVNFCENKRELAYIPVALPLNMKLRNPQCMK